MRDDTMVCDLCGAVNEFLAIQCWNCGYWFSQADYIFPLAASQVYEGEELEEKLEEYREHRDEQY